MSDTKTSGFDAKETAPFSELTGTPKIDRIDPSVTNTAQIATVTQGSNALAPVIEIDRLYESAPGVRSNVVGALELLKDATNVLTQAQTIDNPIDRDRCVQHLQALLPKLFAHRGVGDGFGTIINSLHFVFLNRKGIPLESGQLSTVSRTLRELRTRPALSLEQAVQRIQEWEELGLEVDPPNLGDLLEVHDAPNG